MLKSLQKCLLTASLFFINSIYAGYFTPPHIGTIHRMYISYKNSDTITISSGYCEANGKGYEVIADTDFDITSIPSGADFIYIYIDDDQSDASIPTFTASTTEPTWSDSKQGWYNASDRCFGAVYTSDGSQDIYPFHNVKTKILLIGRIRICDNITPTGNYVPTTIDADDATPVMAYKIGIGLVARDYDSYCKADVVPVANQGGYIGLTTYGYLSLMGLEVYTGTADRSLLIKGEANDDSELRCDIYSWDIER